MDEIEHIQNLIYIIRGQRVMLDFDLSAMYGVETKALNQAVKRNIERFPEDFMFQLTKGEFEILRSQIVISRCADIEGNGNLRSQIVTSKDFSKMRSLPNAFTEQGCCHA
ncbi:MAG: ORF6N domain-containing protein [Prevotellaceae bacterium]|nr:ORF6N domain-containing protein [Prevotellaceae bacterium]